MPAANQSSFHFKIVRSDVKRLAESQASEENAVRVRDS